jgi:predicted DNA-binding protein YlxM (UPF0122 family)
LARGENVLQTLNDKLTLYKKEENKDEMQQKIQNQIKCKLHQTNKQQEK